MAEPGVRRGKQTACVPFQTSLWGHTAISRLTRCRPSIEDEDDDDDEYEDD